MPNINGWTQIYSGRTADIWHRDDKVIKIYHGTQELVSFVHPNILPVLESGEHNHQPFQVYPFIPNTLQSFDPEKFRTQISAAITHMHSLGWAHMDVKPSNILVNNDQLYLADFGSVKRLGTQAWNSKYLHPELRSTIVKPDYDLYALDIIYHELLRN